MKRAFFVLPVAICLAAAVLAGGAAAKGGVTVSASSTSIIVGVPNSEGCAVTVWKNGSEPSESLTLWAEPYEFDNLEPGTLYNIHVLCSDEETVILNVGKEVMTDKAATSSTPRPPDRFGYCSVAGDAFPDGTPIKAGTFLNLLLDQPKTDAHYTGAVPAFYVQGEGITCSLTPSQAALAAASTQRVDMGGVLMPDGIYPFIPQG